MHYLPCELFHMRSDIKTSKNSAILLSASLPLKQKRWVGGIFCTVFVHMVENLLILLNFSWRWDRGPYKTISAGSYVTKTPIIGCVVFFYLLVFWCFSLLFFLSPEICHWPTVQNNTIFIKHQVVSRRHLIL